MLSPARPYTNACIYNFITYRYGCTVKITRQLQKKQCQLSFCQIVSRDEILRFPLFSIDPDLAYYEYYLLRRTAVAKLSGVARAAAHGRGTVCRVCVPLYVRLKPYTNCDGDNCGLCVGTSRNLTYLRQSKMATVAGGVRSRGANHRIMFSSQTGAHQAPGAREPHHTVQIYNRAGWPRE